MSDEDRFPVYRELLVHGARSASGRTVDPSQSELLRAEGVGAITPLIERLAEIKLVGSPSPLVGSDGGMWIGYQLTDQGRAIATRSEERELRRALGRLIGGPASEVSQSLEQLREECSAVRLPVQFRDDFDHTLREMSTCFDHKCFIATIALAGKICEICLKQTLVDHAIQYDPEAGLGRLLGLVRERCPAAYIDESLGKVAGIVTTHRNAAVHARERVPIPSRDQAISVIFAMRDLVQRRLVQRPGD